MKKFIKRIMAVTASAMLALTPVGVMADSYAPADDTNLVLQFYAQNGSGVEQEWLWMDAMDDSLHLKYQAPTHYIMQLDPGRYIGAEDPIYTIGFQMGYYGLQADQTIECAVSFENLVAHFDGYDDVVIPNCAFLEGDNMRSGKGKIPLTTVFTKEMPVADMLLHIKSIEFDANVITLIVRDAEGNEVPGDPVSVGLPTEEATTVEDVTTVAETTVKPTKPPKETTAEQTTIAETEPETEPAIEETSTAAQQEEKNEDKKDDKDSSKNTKIVISIVFIIILLGALGVIGFNFMKKK